MGSSETIVFKVVLAGDASVVGAYLGNIQFRSTLLSFPFSEEEAKKSSTFRELLVSYRFYTSNKAGRYSGQSVLHYSDNQAVLHIMEKGSGKPHLRVLARQIFLARWALNIGLKVEWIFFIRKMKKKNVGLHGLVLFAA